MSTGAAAGSSATIARFRLASPATAKAFGLLTLLLLVAAAPVSAVAHQLGGWLTQLPLMAPFAVVGFIVARRQPRNAIGWLLLTLASLYTVSAIAGSYAVLAFRQGHPDLPLARLAVALTQCWIALPVLLPLPILLFPDGRSPSPRWRWTLRIYLAACVMLLIGTTTKDIAAFTDKQIRVDSSGELVSFSGSGSGWTHVFGAAAFLILVVCGLSWVVRQMAAFRHATGEHRQQLKWLMSGGAFAILGFCFAMFFSGSSLLILRILSFGFFGIVAVPVSIGIGILKYRLYEIDRVISRTLSYAAVTGLLVGVYVGMVALTTRALPFSSPVGVAAATLAAVALFNPLRRRVQRIVDRRFNRARYNAEATVAAFSAGLRDEVDLDRVQRELLDVVERAVQPTHVSVWIRRESPA